MPYHRDYGLFRRVAHWSATALLGVAPQTSNNFGEELDPDQYSFGTLPRSCKEKWWGTRHKEGYWARLDLQMAFPSVSLRALEQGFDHIFTEPEEVDLEEYSQQLEQDAMSGYPSNIAMPLNVDSTRRELANELLNLLRTVEYHRGPIDQQHWRPESANDRRLPGDGSHVGLPTGLAISGMLLNVALAPFDNLMAEAMGDTPHGGTKRWAFLRFADDMLVLAPGVSGLQAALRKVQEGLLVVPPDGGLQLNAEKASPAPVKAWLKTGGQKIRLRRVDFADTLLRRDRLGSFITRLVEDMSHTAATDETSRFGESARDRVSRLVNLAQLNIDDGEVRKDTRLSFAANRLATSFLPDERQGEEVRFLREARMGIATAIDQAPWKFSLWRAAVRAACRRTQSGAPIKEQDATARKWFSSQLKRVAVTTRPESSLQFGGGGDEPPRKTLALELSFVRAVVWREIARALQELRMGQAACSEGGWSSRHWTYRALSEAQFEPAIQFISDFERWAGALYPHASPPDDAWWEHDAIRFATIVESFPVSSVDPAAHQRELGRLRFAALLETTGSPPRSWPQLAVSYAAGGRGVPLPSTERIDLYRNQEGSGTLRQAELLGILGDIDKPETLSTKSHSLWALEEREHAYHLHLSGLNHSARPQFVHELLWSIPDAAAESGWSVSPLSAPQEPLPLRMVAEMLANALTAELATKQKTGGSRPWKIESTLVWGARSASFTGKTRVEAVPARAENNEHLISLASPESWGTPGLHPSFDRECPVAC